MADDIGVMKAERPVASIVNLTTELTADWSTVSRAVTVVGCWNHTATVAIIVIILIVPTVVIIIVVIVFFTHILIVD